MTAPNLAAAITNAKNFILAAKNADGGFPYVKPEASNASSTAWALLALNALGTTGADVDGAKAYLRGAQEENGSFKWQPGSAGDTFTTAYAAHALTGKYWPVKVFAGTAPTPTLSPTSVPTATPTPIQSEPTVTVTPSVTPTPSIVPDEQPQGTSFREQMKQFRAEQRRFWREWRAELRQKMQAFRNSFWGK